MTQLNMYREQPCHRAYKIVEVENGKIKTLFHGVNRSRVMQQGEWIEADVKLGRDGSGEKYYTVGWHTFLKLEEAQEYIKRFRDRKELLRIIECTICDTWLKEHSPAPVILSRYIKFGDLV